MRAFLFTGMAFLMTIPAVILAASLLQIAGTGDTGTVMTIKSDKVAYTYNSISQSFEDTAESLVEAYDNHTRVQGELKEWAEYMERNFSGKAGVNISIAEDRINVTTENTSCGEVVYIGDIDNSSTTGLSINVSTVDNSTRVSSPLGPLEYSPPESNISEYVNESTSTEVEENATYTLSCGANYTFKGYAWDCGGINDTYVKIDSDKNTAPFSRIGDTKYYNWSYMWHPKRQKVYDFCSQAKDDANLYSPYYCINIEGDESCPCSIEFINGPQSAEDNEVNFSVVNNNTQDVEVQKMTTCWDINGQQLEIIEIDGAEVWEGDASSCDTVTLDENVIEGDTEVNVSLIFNGVICAGDGEEDEEDGEVNVNTTFHLDTGESCKTGWFTASCQ